MAKPSLVAGGHLDARARPQWRGQNGAGGREGRRPEFLGGDEIGGADRISGGPKDWPEANSAAGRQFWLRYRLGEPIPAKYNGRRQKICRANLLPIGAQHIGAAKYSCSTKELGAAQSMMAKPSFRPRSNRRNDVRTIGAISER